MVTRTLSVCSALWKIFDETLSDQCYGPCPSTSEDHKGVVASARNDGNAISIEQHAMAIRGTDICPRTYVFGSFDNRIKHSMIGQKASQVVVMDTLQRVCYVFSRHVTLSL